MVSPVVKYSSNHAGYVMSSDVKCFVVIINIMFVQPMQNHLVEIMVTC